MEYMYIYIYVLNTEYGIWHVMNKIWIVLGWIAMMPWETYEYLFIYEYYGISGIYIYMFGTYIMYYSMG